jgi:hypothetical protein
MERTDDHLQQTKIRIQKRKSSTEASPPRTEARAGVPERKCAKQRAERLPSWDGRSTQQKHEAGRKISGRKSLAGENQDALSRDHRTESSPGAKNEQCRGRGPTAKKR